MAVAPGSGMRSRHPIEGLGEETPREVDVTLLSCDVVRSTELTRRLGDRGAYRVTSRPATSAAT
jgi:class 3 adenylate cyclase